MIREAFPAVRPRTSSAFVDTQTWKDFVATHGGLDDLVKETVPYLTGLTIDQLNDLGFAVIDADTDRTWVYVPPAGVTQSQACPGSANAGNALPVGSPLPN